MATAVYEWKQPAPKLPGAPAGTQPQSATDPMGTPSTTPAKTTTMGSADTPSFESMFKAGPAAAQPTPSFNDLFQGMGDQRQQNVQAATQSIAQGFQPAAPSTSGEQARNAFLKSQDETQRQILEQSALAGRGDTGQIRGDNLTFLTQQAQPARADFEAKLQSQEEEQARQRQQDAFGNLLALEGLGSQERISREQMDLTRSEGAAERASREGIAFAGLNLEEKKLAQEASQFTSRQDFDRWALERNLDNEAATRIWQSLENEKKIASEEKLGFANLSVREKELAQAGQQFKDELAFKRFATEGGWEQQEADRVWKSLESEKDRGLTRTESALDRELDRYIADAGFDIDRQQLAENIRQFDSKLSFDQWATQAGLDDNEKARVWEGHLQDLNQKWQTGERLGAQEHQVLIEDKRVQAQQAAQEFDRLTNLEVLGKTQEWDRAKMELANTYQTLRDTNQMTHEQAMTQLRGSLEAQLAQMGIDAESARQAADIKVREWEVNRQLSQQATLANAELLYKYESLRTQAGIDKQGLALRQQEINNQVTQFAQTFGLEQDRVQRTLEMAENRELLETQAILQELAGDDPDMVEFASLQFVGAMQKLGFVSPEEAEDMRSNILAAPNSEFFGSSLERQLRAKGVNTDDPVAVGKAVGREQLEWMMRMAG